MIGRYTLIAITIAAVLAVGFWLTGPSGRDVEPKADSSSRTGMAMVDVKLPETLSANAEIGKMAYDAKCAVCHWANAVGQDGVAPPLVHKIYEPSHHGDAAFLIAAKNGVRAHHWRFGNMPPVEGVTDGDVKMIVTYVRELQRANGIN